MSNVHDNSGRTGFVPDSDGSQELAVRSTEIAEEKRYEPLSIAECNV
jgi:hypothetical protein